MTFYVRTFFAAPFHLPFRLIVGDPENVSSRRLGVVVEGRLDLSEPAADLQMPFWRNYSLVLEHDDPVIANVFDDSLVI